MDMVRHGWSTRASLVRSATDQFYGERSDTVRDAVGHDWIVDRAIDRVERSDMQRRYDALGLRETDSR